MTGWLRKRSLPTRVLVYAAAALLAFAVAAGVGATTAFMIQGNLSLPSRKAPEPADEQGDAPQHRGADADQSQQSEDKYVARVGDIQADSVETFLDSHDKLLRYDSLTAEDVEVMQANKDSLKEFTERVGDLNPPQRYEEQYEAFSSAIRELHAAAQQAYTLAADPTAATQSGFDEYDRRVNEAATGLQRSNEILGRDYKTIEGVQRVNPLS